MKKRRQLNLWRRPLRLAALIVVLSTPAVAQDAGDAIPRHYDGNPDINGVWQAINTAHWNLEDHSAAAGPAEYGVLAAMPPGVGVVVEGEIPYQDWAREQRQKNFENRWREDPEAKCYLPGVPRATYMPFPFQILQGTGQIMIVYGFAEANRTIHMDKDDPEPPPIDSWMGRSHGRWEGDTLVVGGRRLHRAGLVRPRGQLRQRHLARDRAVHADRPELVDVRGDARRRERLHRSVDHPYAAVPPSRGTRPGAGVQVCRVF